MYLSDPIDFDPDGRPTGYSAGGTLIAGSLGDLLLKGSLDSTLLVTSVAQSGVWKVGDSLGPNALVTLRNGGLTGQIAINANGGDGEWLGTIRVAQGFNIVSGPWYELDDADHNMSPSALGGGGAGLQGYEVWGNACDPFPGSTRFRGSIDPNSTELDPPCIDDFDTIKVSFYGNIERASGVSTWGETVTLERKNVLGVYAPVSGISVNGANRTISITKSGGGIWETGNYRLSIVENKLRVNSGDVFTGATQLAVPATSYTFGVAKGCEEFDLNLDTFINMADMVEWMVEPTNLNNYPQVDEHDAATLERGIAEHGG